MEEVPVNRLPIRHHHENRSLKITETRPDLIICEIPGVAYAEVRPEELIVPEGEEITLGARVYFHDDGRCVLGGPLPAPHDSETHGTLASEPAKDE